jgi:hypothetical protein
MKHSVLLGIFILSLAVTGMAQDFGGTVVVAADRTTLISGETMQLFAQVRDGNGNTTPNETLSWSSSDPSVLSVDSNGVVSALLLGTARIFVSGRGRSAILGMQVLPDHIEVLPARSEMYVGDQLQFAATAFDINQNPIANTLFQWNLVNAGGFFTPQGSISSTGMLKAIATGPVTVKATVQYFSANESETSSYTGIAQVVIKSKKEFRLSPVVATAPVQRTFRLRSNPWNHMAGNDSGQIAFTGSLDGLTSALLLYDKGSISVLASAGVPGPLSGSFVWDFGPPGINKWGDIVLRADVRGNASGILLVNGNGANYIVVDGQSVGGLLELSNFNTTRYSINDKGEVLFTAVFQDSSGPIWNTGLFKYSSTGIQVMATTADTLPGIGSNFQISYFGIDAAGVAYFSAYQGDTAALYRTDGGQPEKIAAAGDMLAGSTIMSLIAVGGFGLSSDGTVGYGADLKDGTAVVVQYRASYGQRTRQVSWINQVHAIGADGDVYFSGGTADGWGVFRWRGDQVLTGLLSSSTIDGGSISNLVDAFVTGSGDLYVQLSTTASSFVLAQASTARVLFKQDTAVNATANVDFLSLVANAHAGAPDLLTGGNAASVYEWNSSGLAPVYVAGDTSSGGSWFISNAVRASSGELYTSSDSGIFRHTNGHAETILRLPSTVAAANLQWILGGYENSSMAANSNGMVAFPAWAETRYVVATVNQGRSTILMQLGGSTPTPSPSGGTFVDWLPSAGPVIALDDDGRTMVGVQIKEGKSGLFLFENGQWHQAALFDMTQIDGDTIRSVNSLHAAGRNFYAQFATDNGWVVAEYVSGEWKMLMNRGDVMPNGAAIYYLNGFDVNRAGDVAFVAQVSGGSVIGLRTIDGNYHLVHITSEPTDAGDILPYYNFSVNLQDDRKVYFTGIDIFDRNLLYLADPLF